MFLRTPENPQTMEQKETTRNQTNHCSGSAKILDHVLQPLAQAYDDFLSILTQLISVMFYNQHNKINMTVREAPKIRVRER